MPCDYKNYPANWKSEIRPDILKRAGNCCEHEGCGVKNGAYGYRAANGDFYEWSYIEDALENHGDDLFSNVLSNCYDKKGSPTKAIKIVLTIAHLDHDTTNNDYNNLKALCQLHHLRHDVGHHKQTRRKNKGLQELFK